MSPKISNNPARTLTRERKKRGVPEPAKSAGFPRQNQPSKSECRFRAASEVRSNGTRGELKKAVGSEASSGAAISGIAKAPAKQLKESAMSTVADQLRQAREAKKLTVNQVADATKIRTDHIRALEDGNYEMFSAPVYVRGSVRSYAALLKLDVPQVMAALNAELGETSKFRESPSRSGGGRGPLDWVMLQLSKVNWHKAPAVLGAVLLLCALVFVYLSWRHSKTADTLKGLKPGVYRPARTPSGDTLPLPPAAPRRS